MSRAEYMMIKTTDSQERVNVTLSFREARIIVAALLGLAHKMQERNALDNLTMDIITDWGKMPPINAETVELLANRVHPSIEIQFPYDIALDEPEDASS